MKAINLFCLLLLLGSGLQAAPPLVFAAASTGAWLQEAAEAYAQGGKTKPRFSLASSSTLARQIAQGAPAEIFLSANEAWMDQLEQKQLLEPNSRKDLLKNRLVLVAPADSPLAPLQLGPQTPMLQLLQGGRLALGDPGHVPLGIYAKEALTHLGLFQQVAQHLAPALDARQTLLLVERGECPLGVVYASDLGLAPGLKVLAWFPPASHQAIRYPLALVKGQVSAEGRGFYQFLFSPLARKLAQKHGFEPWP